jgi:purine-binding chemotaxis protein CheW
MDQLENASVTASASPKSAAAGPVIPASNELISFAIGDEQYGVDIMAVREIKGWSEITHIPRQPEYVCGVLNLRGVIVPIVDLRCRFGQGHTEPTALHIVIVVQIEQRLIGLLADRVLDIVSFKPADLQAVPQTAHDAKVDFLAGLVMAGEAMIALIDLPNLFKSAPGDELPAEMSAPA